MYALSVRDKICLLAQIFLLAITFKLMDGAPYAESSSRQPIPTTMPRRYASLLPLAPLFVNGRR